VGGDSAASVDQVRQIFKHLTCDFIETDINSAEIIKYACNSFHALKIVFANEIGRLAQSLSVDSHKIMEIFCKDRKLNISEAYLRPGFAFGGSCLPKDLRALLYMARKNDIELPTIGSLLFSNDVHLNHAVRFVISGGFRRVGMVGLSFKSGTDDLRESPLVTLAETFIGKGLDLKIYDPEVEISRLIGANKRYIEESIPHIASLMVDNCLAATEDRELIIVGISSPAIESALVENVTSPQTVLDLCHLKRRDELRGIYRGICW
jgi:GDP-mannose 6-dehydrogenase